ncbi:MAG: transporter, Spinster family, sphingosine-phosphate transporter [Verrucomicrobiota bacterium]
MFRAIGNSMTASETRANPGAQTALALLLGINLFNYIDRQILAAVEPNIRAAFFAPGDPNAMAMTGALAPAFLVTYMLSAPILGFLADRFSRWIIVGACVILWSFATAASGFALTFVALFVTRIFVGIGEGGYGPAAPTILADYFSLQVRGRIMAIFCAAIPVGSALGYVLGGIINHQLGWRWAFYLVAIPGVLLGLFCFYQQDPRARSGVRAERRRAHKENYLALLRTRSFVFNCLAQTAMTFALGGLAFWMPAYLIFRNQPPEQATPIFGGITVVAGLLSTLLGGFVADRLQKRFSGSYFLVSGLGMLAAFPLLVLMLYTPFPLAWVLLFGAVFFVFLNTGPSNAALANVAGPKIRATAFALNILIIHALGDALSPPLLGAVAGHSPRPDGSPDMNVAFLVVSLAMLVSGVIWLFGMKYLAADTAAVENQPVA